MPRSSSYSPLFQAFLNYRQNICEVRAFCGCESKGELLGAGQTSYDLSLDTVDDVAKIWSCWLFRRMCIVWTPPRY